MITVEQARLRLRWGAILAVVGAIGLLLTVLLKLGGEGMYVLFGAIITVGLVRVVFSAILLRRARSKEL